MPPGSPLTSGLNPLQQALADAGRQRLIMEALAAHGRGADTMLAHINPREALALKLMGGAGTPNPATGLPQFDDSDPIEDIPNYARPQKRPQSWWASSGTPSDAPVSRGSSFAGEGPSGTPNPDPTLKEGPDFWDKMLAKFEKNPGMFGAALGGLGGMTGGPMAGALGSVLGAGLGLGGKELGLFGSNDATSGTPESYTAGGIPAFKLDSDSGGSSPFTLAKLGLLGKLGKLF